MPLFFFCLLIGCTSSSNENSNAENTKKNSNIDSSNAFSKAQNENKIDSGEIIFKNNCDSCHIAPYKEAINGPWLRTFLIKLPTDSLKSLVEYISNSKNCNPGFCAYVNKFNNANSTPVEHTYEDILTTKEIEDVTNYMLDLSKR